MRTKARWARQLACFCLLGLVLNLLQVLSVMAQEPFAVDHNRSSARATMLTFLENSEQESEAAISAAASCLDFSDMSEPATDAQKIQTVKRLKEIIDRLAWVNLHEVSDQPDGDPYRFPPQARYQPIVIAPSSDGAWLFTSQTVARIDQLYQQYQHLPLIVSSTPWYRQMIVPLGNEAWRITALFVCLLIGIIVGKIGKCVLESWGERLQLRERICASAGVRALARAVTPACLVLGIQIGLRFLILNEVVESIGDTIIDVLMAVVVAYAAFQLVDVLDAMMKTFSERTESKMDDILVPLVRTSLRATIVILALVQIATILSDKPMTSVIAGLGVGGLAIGLASQDMVKNLFGSVMILSDHPFEMGDFIEVSGHSGNVETVGFRSTRIRTSEGHLVTLPNGSLANADIKNISHRPFLKRSFGVGLTYDTPPEKVEKAIVIIKEILSDHSGMDQSKPPLVHFSDFTDSTLNIAVIYWHFPAEWSEFCELNENVNLAIFRQFNEEGIEFAFPSQTIYMAGDAA